MQRYGHFLNIQIFWIKKYTKFAFCLYVPENQHITKAKKFRTCKTTKTDKKDGENGYFGMVQNMPLFSTEIALICTQICPAYICTTDKLKCPRIKVFCKRLVFVAQTLAGCLGPRVRKRCISVVLHYGGHPSRPCVCWGYSFFVFVIFFLKNFVLEFCF